MKARSYQQRALDGLWEWFSTNYQGNPIVDACVGAGKSLMIALFSQRAIEAYPQTRILVLTHQQELLVQNLEKLRLAWPDADVGLAASKLGRKVLHRRITYGTIGSVFRRAKELGHIDLVFADECHMIPPEMKGMWRQVFEILKKINPNLRVIGWTGTPYRGNGIWLTAGKDPIFTHIATRIVMDELLQIGYLAPLTNESTGITIDTSHVATTSEDYVEKDLDKVMNTADVIDRTCRDVVERAKNRRLWLVYCVTVDHAENVCAKLIELGIDAVCVTGDTPDGDRDRAFKAARSGRIRCIVNVAVMTTGTDFPMCDCLVLLRPTKSPVLYVQIGGRGMRVMGKDIEESKLLGKSDCLWLDYTSTTVEMGPINRIKGRKPSKKTGVAPTKICDSCGNTCPLSARNCPACGHEFEIVENEADPHGDKPTDAPIMSRAKTDEDGRRIYPVTDVVYSLHRKADSPATPSLRVDYMRGAAVIASEWVALSHAGYIKMKAERWWKDRSKIPQIPSSSQQAIEWLEYSKDILLRPSQIKVAKENGYDRIVEYNWPTEATAGAEPQQDVEESADHAAPEAAGLA